MSLGVLKVAASLEAANVDVEVLDLSGYANAVGIVQQHARQSDASVFGITATTPQYPAAVSIAASIRSAGRTILGGPHATLTAAAAKKEKSKGITGRATRSFAAMGEKFDCIVAGDGEMAILGAIQDGAPPYIDADGRPSSLFMDDAILEATPIPARHLVDVSSYHYQIDGVPALSLIAQLGCPFGCGFCAGRHSPMLRHIRKRSSESVVAEMMHMSDTYGCRGFMFYDDEMNVNKNMVELMELITKTQRDRGEEWRLRGFIKAELFNDDQARSMWDAGFRWILVGFESGSPRILENIAKRATREDNTRCIETARRHGLKTKALMSLGHPGESEATVGDTRRWLIEMEPNDFDVTVITPYPGSPYYDDARQNGGFYTYTARGGDVLHMEDVDYSETADYYKGAPGAYVSHVWTDELDPGSLVRERDDLEFSVRQRLGVTFNPSAAALSYEPSMGQTALPSHLLRISHGSLPGSKLHAIQS